MTHQAASARPRTRTPCALKQSTRLKLRESIVETVESRILFTFNTGSNELIQPHPLVLPASQSVLVQPLAALVGTVNLSPSSLQVDSTNFAIPATAASLSVDVKRTTAGPLDYVRVLFGTGAAQVQLASLDASTVTATPVTTVIPIPASLRGTTSTLSFQLVSGASVPKAVVQISNVKTLNDLAGDRIEAIKAGLNTLNNLADAIAGLSDLAAPVALKVSGVTQKVSDLLDTATTLKNVLTARISAYLAAAPDPSTEGLKSFLQATVLPNLAVSFPVINILSNDTEVRFNLTFSAAKTIGGLSPVLGSDEQTKGFLLDASATLGATVTLSGDLAFGVKLNAGQALPGSFFARLNKLAVDIRANATLINASAKVGLLSASVTNGQFVLNTGIALTPKPAFNSKDISLVELGSIGLTDLFTVTKTGDVKVVMPMSAKLSASLPALNATFNLTDTNLFDATPPVISTTGLDSLSSFRELSAGDVVTMFGKLKTWLTDLASSTLFDVSLPFVDSMNIGEGLDLAKGFGDQIFSKITDANGVAKFDSFQSMLGLLGNGNSVKYDAGTSTLTFPVSFNQTLAAITGKKIGFDLSLGSLAGLSSTSTVSITPTVSGVFTMGIDLRPLGAGAPFAAGTLLSNLNGGDGIAAAGDALSFEVILSDGTKVPVALAGLTTLGQVINKINTSPGAAGKVVASLDLVNKRVVLTDKTTGATLFKVNPTNLSLASIGLGLAGQDAVGVGATKVINGTPLHGDDVSKHVFVLADSALTPAKLGGSLVVTAADVDAVAKLGFVEVGVTNGSGNANASFELKLKDGSTVDGRVTVPELLDSIVMAFEDATASASANFALPITIKPANFLPAIAGGTPTITVAWADPKLGLADGVNGSGGSLATNSTTTITYNTAAQRIKTLTTLNADDLRAGLAGIASFLTGPGAFKALTSKLPIINLTLGELVGLGEQFQDFVTKLEAAVPTSLADLQTKLQQSFTVAGATVALSWDNTPNKPAIKVSFSFVKSASTTQGIDFALGGGRNLFGANGEASLNLNAASTVKIDFGLDMTTPASPKPFLYDTTRLEINAAARSGTLNFGASVGPFGIFVHDRAAAGSTPAQKAVATFDADGKPGGPDASYVIVMKSIIGGRHYFTTDVISQTTDTLTGKAEAILPIFFPTTNSAFGEPVKLTFNLATGATTISDPFSGATAPNLNLNMDVFRAAFDEGLSRLKEKLASALEGFDIPLIGGKLSDALSFLDTLRDAIYAQPQLSNALSFNTLKTALTNALNGLNWPGTSLTAGSLLNAGSANEAAEFKLKIKRDFLLESSPLAFDVGIPGLGLKLTNAQVGFGVGFDFDLGFGISRANGFYLITNPNADELKLTAAAEATALSAVGELGLFKIKADKVVNQPIRAGATFLVNLKDPSGSDNKVTLSDLGSTSFSNLLDFKFGKDAQGRDSGVDINLKLSAGFTNPNLPALATTLGLKWTFGQPGVTANQLAGTSSFALTGSPNVQFANVEMQLGELFARTLRPVIDNIANVLKPIEPIISALTKRIPVISDLMGQSVSLADLAKFFGLSDIEPYLAAADRVKKIQNILRSISTTNGINLGSLNFSLPSTATKLSTIKITPGMLTAPAIAPVNQANGSEKEFFNNSTSGGGLSFPLLDNPTAAFGLLMGQNVDLVKFDMPTLDVRFKYKQFFPIIGPLGAQVTGQIGAKAHVSFGLDTLGFTGGKGLLEGFYINDLDKSGNDVPEVQLYGSITAGAEFNAVLVKAGVEGGIFANVDFNLHDDDGDGKIRLSEFAKNFALGAIYVFDVSGKLEAGLTAYVEVDLVFWSDRFEYNIARVTLLDFNLNRPAGATFNPGTVNAAGLLTLNTTEEDDNFRILPGEKAGDIVIQTRGTLYPRTGVKSISFTGKGGNDEFYVDPEAKLLAGGTIVADGGTGDDALFGGAVPTTLLGGAGFDQLTAGIAPSRLEGGDDDDLLSGGDAADYLDGGNGNDTLEGHGADDTLVGNAGNDFLFGGAGNDNLQGGTGNDSLTGNEGDDTLLAGTGTDSASGGDGNDVLTGGLVLFGGAGNDKLTGNAVANTTLIGGAGDDSIVAGSGNDLLMGDDTAAGETGNDTIIAGAGADTIIGDAGNDSVDAGTGDDSISTGAGNDTILAGDGNDTVDAGDGPDRVTGGVGNDQINTGQGNDLAVAGPEAIAVGQVDDDTVIGGAGNDTLGGGTGNDLLAGDFGAPLNGSGGSASGPDAFGNDVLYGGNGFDSLYGQGGNDVLHGNTGIDELMGGIGNDTLFGGSDSDLMEGGDGADSLNGGTGADVMKLDTDATYTTLSGDTFVGYGGNGQIILENGTTAPGVNQDDSATATDILLVAGTESDDTIRIGEIAGVAGAPSRLNVSYNGKNFVTNWKTRNTATNQIVFQVRQIQVVGGAGNDLIEFLPTLNVNGMPVTGANQYVVNAFGGLGNDTLRGTAGRDQLFGGKGSDDLYGNGGNDKLWGDEFGGGDVATNFNRLYGGTGNDDLVGGQGRNQLYAWSGDPAAKPGKPFGTYDTNGDLEATGLDRMLGGPGDDLFFGGTGVAFMYGNGGFDIFIDQNGKRINGADSGVNLDLWKEYARNSGKVWYIPTTDANDVVDVLLSNGQLTVKITEYNSSGAQTGESTFTPANTYGTGKDTSAQQFRYSTAVPGSFAAGAQAGLYQQGAGWSANNAAPTTSDNFDVILIDTFKGDDTVTIQPGVPKTVWIDGGEGDDVITIKSNGIILPDKLEGVTDPRAKGKNDTRATASDLGALSGSARHQNLTIHTGLAPADVDWFKFNLGAAPVVGDSILVDGLTPNDGMVVKLYNAAGTLLSTSSTITGRLFLQSLNLTVGNTYFLKVASNGDKPNGVGIASIYTLDFKLGATNPQDNATDYSAVQNVPTFNVLVGGVGDDTLSGGLGEDWVLGGDGNDVLSGGRDQQAIDLIFGGAGDDTFILTPDDLLPDTTVGTYVASDLFDGGGGIDKVVYEGQPDSNNANAGAFPDFVAFGYNNTLERYELTTKVWDTLSTTFAVDSSNVERQRYQFFDIANTESIEFNFAGGDDVFHADENGFTMPDGFTYGINATSTAPLKDISVQGGVGADSITTGAGNDTVDAGAGLDDDTVVTNSGVDWAYGREGNDSINTGAGGDVAYGGDGNDWIDGGADNNALFGETGNDTLLASGSFNTLYGGSSGSNIDTGNDDIRGVMSEGKLLIGDRYFGTDSLSARYFITIKSSGDAVVADSFNAVADRYFYTPSGTNQTAYLTSRIDVSNGFINFYLPNGANWYNDSAAVFVPASLYVDQTAGNVFLQTGGGVRKDLLLSFNPFNATIGGRVVQTTGGTRVGGDTEIDSNDWTRVNISYTLTISPDRRNVTVRITYLAYEGNGNQSLGDTRLQLIVDRTFAISSSELRTIASLQSSSFNAGFEWVRGVQHGFVPISSIGILSNIEVRFDGSGGNDQDRMALVCDVNIPLTLNRGPA